MDPFPCWTCLLWNSLSSFHFVIFSTPDFQFYIFMISDCDHHIVWLYLFIMLSSMCICLFFTKVFKNDYLYFCLGNVYISIYSVFSSKLWCSVCDFFFFTFLLMLLLRSKHFMIQLPWEFVLILKIYLLFTKREGWKERERNINVPEQRQLVASGTPPSGVLAWNAGMCRDLETLRRALW